MWNSAGRNRNDISGGFFLVRKKIKVLNVLVHEKGYRENLFCTSADEGKRKYAAISLQMMTENRASYLILSHFYF